MKPIFWAQSKDDKLNLGSGYLRNRFAADLQANPGARYKIERITPESRKQRGFYHGAVIPLWAYLNEMDYHDGDILDMLHGEAKKEFNGDMVVIDGKPRHVGRSTKGELAQGYLDKFVDYLEEQYAIDRTKVLDTKQYEKWRDEIFAFSPQDGPDCFICYMKEIGWLPKVQPQLSTSVNSEDNNRML